MSERAGHAFYALGRRPVGEMNKTEARYARELELLKAAGEVLWWKFQGIKLRLAGADGAFYTPDFNVLARDMVLEMHEVKGHWLDDARVKIKVAAAMYPFRFVAVRAEAQKRGGGWARESFGGEEQQGGGNDGKAAGAARPG